MHSFFIFLCFELEEFHASCEECTKLCYACDEWLPTISSVFEEMGVLNKGLVQGELDRDFVISVFTDQETQKDGLERVLAVNARLCEVLEEKREAERKRVTLQRILIFLFTELPYVLPFLQFPH